MRSSKPASEPHIPLVRRRPSLDCSITGLVYCSMMMFMGLAAINTQANLLFGVFGLMIGILIVSGTFSRIVLKKLRVRRNLPKHGVVGEPLTVYYEITNDKKFWPSLSVSLAELDGVDGFIRQPQCYMLHAAPKMTATVPLELVPKRRGLREFYHFQIGTSFPFGFIKRASVDKHKDSICVFPAMGEVDRRVMMLCRSADNIGESVRPQAGGMDEFYGLREYRHGDNPRTIYWRRSARTGVLVAKEMTRVAPPRLMLLVDTHLENPSAEGRALVERAIAMAASLASTALEQEMAVGLCAWSGRPISLPPNRGKQQREELLTLLALLPENPSYDRGQLLEQAAWRAKSGTTLVMLTANDFHPPAPEQARGRMVIFSAASDRGKAWFGFGPEIIFDGEPEAQDLTNAPGAPGGRNKDRAPAARSPVNAAADVEEAIL